MPPELHGKLARQAEARGISLNKLCTKLLENSLQSEQSWISKKLEQKLQDRIGEDLLSICVFGSRTKNSHTENSDIDLLLVLKSERSIERKLYFEWDKIIENESEEDWKLYSPQFVSLPRTYKEAGSLWLEVALSGVIVYETGDQVTKILEKLRSEIAAGTFERKLTHGQPYWTRKEVNP